MKIALKKSNRVVTHANGNIRFSPLGLVANGVTHPSMTEETAEIVSIDSLPDPWGASKYTFENGVFTAIDPNWAVEIPTITEAFTALKTDFLTYINDNYDIGTQLTMQAAYVSPDVIPEKKTAIGSVWAWIQTVQSYYLAKKTAVLGGDVSTTWDFSIFDATKPETDWEDFIPAYE